MKISLALFLIVLFSCSLYRSTPTSSSLEESLDKAFRNISNNIVDRITKDENVRKRVVVLNFVNDELDTNSNETQLGIYLARSFTYFLSEEGNKKDIKIFNRDIGEKITIDEMKYRKSTPAESLLALFEADYYITASYHLYENELEVIELVASRSIGAREVGRVRGRIAIADEDYQRIRAMEKIIVPWKQINPKLLNFLVQSGEWHKPIKNIRILDYYTKKPVTSDTLYLSQYIRIQIELDSLPAYLYILDWDQEERKLSFLYPNEYDRINPVTKRQITVPSVDTFAFPVTGAVKNAKIGDYNWIKVFVSKERINSFPVFEGFISESDARLKNIEDELNNIGSQNWSSKIIDFWVKKKE